MSSNATAFALAAFVKAQYGMHHPARYAISAGVHDEEAERPVQEIRDAIARTGTPKDPVKMVAKSRPPAETDEESIRRVEATRAAAASLEAAKRAARKAAVAARRKAFVRSRCAHPKCGKYPCFAADASRTRAFCKEHKTPGMKNYVSRRCAHSDCDKQPTFGDPDNRRADFCARHKDPGMTCVNGRKTRDSPSGATADSDASGSAGSVSCDGGGGGGGVKRRRPASPSSRPSSKNRKPGKRSAQMQLFVKFKLELQSEGV